MLDGVRQQRILGPWPTTNSYNRIVGLTLINVFTPKGAGPGANYVIGKRVRDLYNRVIVSGVFFGAPSGPEALGNPSPEGYFQLRSVWPLNSSRNSGPWPSFAEKKAQLNLRPAAAALPLSSVLAAGACQSPKKRWTLPTTVTLSGRLLAA